MLQTFERVWRHTNCNFHASTISFLRFSREDQGKGVTRLESPLYSKRAVFCLLIFESLTSKWWRGTPFFLHSNSVRFVLLAPSLLDISRLSSSSCHVYCRQVAHAMNPYPPELPRYEVVLHSDWSRKYEGVSKSIRTESITKHTLTFGITRWEATQRVMAAKLTRLTHKIAIQLHVVAEGCAICSSRSRRPVRKLLDTPSYFPGLLDANSEGQGKVVPVP
jgi:hypothetical protein